MPTIDEKDNSGNATFREVSSKDPFLGRVFHPSKGPRRTNGTGATWVPPGRDADTSELSNVS
jgi:hypothetical protein